MEIEKTLPEYAEKRWIHINTAKQQLKAGKLEKITVKWVKVWYINTRDVASLYFNGE